MRPGTRVYCPERDEVGVVTGELDEWLEVDFGGRMAALATDELVSPSQHAMGRWRQRVGGDGSGVADSWARASRVDGVTCLDGDEFRHDPEAGVVLVRTGSVVSTVLVHTDWKSSLRQAVEG